MKVPRVCSRFRSGSGCRLFLVALACLAGCVSASATVTVLFTSTATVATNWGNSDDQGGERLTWGVIIDTTGNGFLSTYLPSGVDYGQAGAAQALSTPGGLPTDDVLVLASSTMSLTTTTNDGAVIGMNRVLNVTNIPTLTRGITPGDAFMIVWFDRTQGGAVTPATTAVAGDRFGVFADASFVIPQDAETRSYFTPFAGPDPLKLMNGTFVPEPSAALLSLLGAAALVRRRR